MKYIQTNYVLICLLGLLIMSATVAGIRLHQLDDSGQAGQHITSSGGSGVGWAYTQWDDLEGVPGDIADGDDDGQSLTYLKHVLGITGGNSIALPSSWNLWTEISGANKIARLTAPDNGWVEIYAEGKEVVRFGDLGGGNEGVVTLLDAGTTRSVIRANNPSYLADWLAIGKSSNPSYELDVTGSVFADDFRLRYSAGEISYNRIFRDGVSFVLQQTATSNAASTMFELRSNAGAKLFTTTNGGSSRVYGNLRVEGINTVDGNMVLNGSGFFNSGLTVAGLFTASGGVSGDVSGNLNGRSDYYHPENLIFPNSGWAVRYTDGAARYKFAPNITAMRFSQQITSNVNSPIWEWASNTDATVASVTNGGKIIANSFQGDGSLLTNLPESSDGNGIYSNSGTASVGTAVSAQDRPGGTLGRTKLTFAEPSGSDWYTYFQGKGDDDDGFYLGNRVNVSGDVISTALELERGDQKTTITENTWYYNESSPTRYRGINWDRTNPGWRVGTTSFVDMPASLPSSDGSVWTVDDDGSGQWAAAPAAETTLVLSSDLSFSTTSFFTVSELSVSGNLAVGTYAIEAVLDCSQAGQRLEFKFQPNGHNSSRSAYYVAGAPSARIGISSPLFGNSSNYQHDLTGTLDITTVAGDLNLQVRSIDGGSVTLRKGSRVVLKKII